MDLSRRDFLKVSAMTAGSLALPKAEREIEVSDVLLEETLGPSAVYPIDFNNLVDNSVNGTLITRGKNNGYNVSILRDAGIKSVFSEDDPACNPYIGCPSDPVGKLRVDMSPHGNFAITGVDYTASFYPDGNPRGSTRFTDYMCNTGPDTDFTFVYKSDESLKLTLIALYGYFRSQAELYNVPERVTYDYRFGVGNIPQTEGTFEFDGRTLIATKDGSVTNAIDIKTYDELCFTGPGMISPETIGPCDPRDKTYAYWNDTALPCAEDSDGVFGIVQPTYVGGQELLITGTDPRPNNELPGAVLLTRSDAGLLKQRVEIDTRGSEPITFSTGLIPVSNLLIQDGLANKLIDTQVPFNQDGMTANAHEYFAVDGYDGEGVLHKQFYRFDSTHRKLVLVVDLKTPLVQDSASATLNSPTQLVMKDLQRTTIPVRRLSGVTYELDMDNPIFNGLAILYRKTVDEDSTEVRRLTINPKRYRVFLPSVTR